MPVPVPHFSKAPAHQVYKPRQSGEDANQAEASALQQLTHSLPASAGPPPSFGTREEWINSLPSWRKLKPRRIWEDACAGEGRGGNNFSVGLTRAGNASVIKGTHAQACIPPLCTLFQNRSLAPVSPQRGSEDADDEMSSDCSVMDHGQYDNESQWSASSPIATDLDPAMDVANGDELQYGPVEDDRPGWHRDDGAVFEEAHFERGAFSPIYEDESPEMIRGHDVSSSPIGPATPFGDFVDRAVAAASTYTSLEALPNIVEQELQYRPVDDQYFQYSSFQQEPKEPPSASEPVTIPSSTINYKKLAEPLSEWVATYVWKLCTTGMSLPSEFAVPMNGASTPYANTPPSYLAGSIHSLFLSTLLQPSAILLALWYIARLPVNFGAVGLGPDHVKELHFRVELLGENRCSVGKDIQETNAPFRLIVLGCMLANKWLDDHTFSNKTWQTISNVPIESLNKLESLALDIFSHDLSTPACAWTQWLTHLTEYHRSLSSPTRPQPISRPSTNPHSIVHRALSDILNAPAGDSPEPVFLGLEERRREKLGIEDLSGDSVDVLEIDLDEDGPLREEYLPKRRVSRTDSVRSVRSRDAPDSKFSLDQARDWDGYDARNIEAEKFLPPPAKWSPAADEPIFRDRGRASGHYVAVQPSIPAAHFPFPLPPYQQAPSWPAVPSYVPPSRHLAPGFVYDPAPPTQQILPAYTLYSYSVPISHSRTQSLASDHENRHPRDHFRSYSQSTFDYRCGDIGQMANDVLLASRPEPQWCAPYRQPFGQHPNVNHQSSWLRT